MNGHSRGRRVLDDPEAAEAMRLLFRRGYTLSNILGAYGELELAEGRNRSHIEDWADTGGGE